MNSNSLRKRAGFIASTRESRGIGIAKNINQIEYSYSSYFPPDIIFANAIKLGDLIHLGVPEYTPLTTQMLQLLMHKVAQYPTNEHICLMFERPYNHHEFCPYLLKIVRPTDINDKDFCIVSRHGWLFFSKQNTEYMSMSEFHRELILFERIKKIQFCQQFRLFKNLILWRIGFRRRNYANKKRQLENLLLINKIPLYCMMLQLFKMSEKIRSVKFLSIKSNYTYEFGEFLAQQRFHAQNAAIMLRHFEGYVVQMIVVTCRVSIAGHKNGMTDHAADHLAQLCNFVYLLDYHIHNTYIYILKNSVVNLLWEVDNRAWGAERKHFPIPPRLRTLCENYGLFKVNDENSKNRTIPLFTMECKWNRNKIKYAPSLPTVIKSLRAVIYDWKRIILRYPNMMTNNMLRQYLPLSNQGPSMKLQITSDPDLKQIQEFTELLLKRSLKMYDSYTSTFDGIRLFCIENSTILSSQFQSAEDARNFKIQFERFKHLYHISLHLEAQLPSNGISRLSIKYIKKKVKKTLENCICIVTNPKLQQVDKGVLNAAQAMPNVAYEIQMLEFRTSINLCTYMKFIKFSNL